MAASDHEHQEIPPPDPDNPGAVAVWLLERVHPLAARLPPQTDVEFQGLFSGVREVGAVEMPVTVYQGQLLDGVHRCRCCVMLNIDPPIEEYHGDDPRAFVRRRNVDRRHLTDSQRALLAADEVTSTRGSNQHSASDQNEVTRQEAARMWNTTPRSVDRALDVLRMDDQEALDAVRVERKALATVQREARSRRALRRQATAPPAGPEPAVPAAPEPPAVSESDEVSSGGAIPVDASAPSPPPPPHPAPSPWTSQALDAVVLLLLHRRCERILLVDADRADIADVAARLGIDPAVIDSHSSPAAGQTYSVVAVSALDPAKRDWTPLWKAVRPRGRLLLHSADRTTPKGIRLVVASHYSALAGLGGSLGTIWPVQAPPAHDGAPGQTLVEITKDG